MPKSFLLSMKLVLVANVPSGRNACAEKNDPAELLTEACFPRRTVPMQQRMRRQRPVLQFRCSARHMSLLPQRHQVFVQRLQNRLSNPKRIHLRHTCIPSCTWYTLTATVTSFLQTSSEKHGKRSSSPTSPTEPTTCLVNNG